MTATTGAELVLSNTGPPSPKHMPPVDLPPTLAEMATERILKLGDDFGNKFGFGLKVVLDTCTSSRLTTAAISQLRRRPLGQC